MGEGTGFLSRSILISIKHPKKQRKKKKEEVYLASFIVEDAFRIFEHLLSPQVEEVIRIRVEFETVFPVIPNKERNNRNDLISGLDCPLVRKYSSRLKIWTRLERAIRAFEEGLADVGQLCGRLSGMWT